MPREPITTTFVPSENDIILKVGNMEIACINQQGIRFIGFCGPAYTALAVAIFNFYRA
jgi:hypothetical protein